VGMSLLKITTSILRKQNSVLSVSVLLNGEFGLKDVCLSVPCVVSDGGIEKIISSPLYTEETVLLKRSAAVIKEAIDSLP